MEALRIYDSTAYKSNIELLTVLFTKLEEPAVADPEVTEEKMVTDEDGTVTKTVSTF